MRRIEADIRRTWASLQGDEALLGYSRIYAPIAGPVVSLEARPGQTLNADLPDAQPAARRRPVGHDRVDPGVGGRRLAAARGRAVFTTLAQDGRQWRGTVRQVLPMPQPEPAEAAGGAAAQPAAGAKAVFYTVLFDVSNLDHALLPQMSAQVAFVTRQVEDAVLAPLAALRPAGEGAGVDMDRDARPPGPTGSGSWRTAERSCGSCASARATAAWPKSWKGLAEGELLILNDRAADGGMPRFVL